MSRPGSGRRPDSLFDSRYRYDFIYPRGRSGETLRAYDTLNGDQPVVIKRPALQDAPPMRAGQEVSIMTEKRALERLSGHAVLTELRNVGTFRVGGQTHHYIAMDMAQGETVESIVMELSRRGERMSELEMLVIFDNLLDLLQTAHEKKIIYNDVDAKHLFWDRSTYRLKVIDWGNAVFLDSDSPPAYASRATDITQVGQLIYFVVSDGHRAEVGKLDPASDLDDHVPAKLKAIINKAVNADTAVRYADIAALRQDLAELRRPLERARDGIIEKARNRLPNATSQDQLEQLKESLQEAQQISPAFPPIVELQTEIDQRLKQLSIQADLDAVRIYMTSGNMARAAALLDEVYNRAGDSDQPLLNFLLNACTLMQAQPITPPPSGFSPSLDALFHNDLQGAARVLVTTDEPRTNARVQQAMLAELMTRFIPGIVLLRPHLIRLEDQLGRSGNRLQSLVQGLLAKLNEPTAPGIQPLQRMYQLVSDAMADLNSDLKALGGETIDSPFATAVRAKRAADDVVELLDVVAQNVLADPSRAGNALWRAAAVDPGNPGFDAVGNTLNVFHADLEQIRGFVPAADGSNISDFFSQALIKLQPYATDLSDARFKAMLQGIDAARTAWTQVIDFIALGGRKPALTNCKQAADAIRALCPATAHWFDDYMRRIEDAPRVEYLSPNVPVGRALADGWEAWDRGRGGESQSPGERALSVAVTDSEKRAARRLIDLSETLSSWLANDGPANVQRTDQTEQRVLALFLPEEEAARQTFTEQMPSNPIYLKAMTKGIVEPMREASSAAVRALFLYYVLRGVLALHQEKPDDANFWKEAATKTLSQARLHPAYQALDTAITRRQLILDAVAALNNVKHVADLPPARIAVRAPLAGSQLEAADQAMRAIDDALKRWPDGDFRAARQLLDSAIERIGIAETAMGKDLTPFKTWLQDLASSAELLQQSRRTIEQAALVPADDPDPAVSEAHQKLVEITRRDLGEAYNVQIRQWRDTYNAIRDMYVDDELTKADKLHLFATHFASLFIDRQPALPIYRHWQGVIHTLPDDKPQFASTPRNIVSPAQATDDDDFMGDLTPAEPIADADEAPARSARADRAARAERQADKADKAEKAAETAAAAAAIATAAGISTPALTEQDEIVRTPRRGNSPILLIGGIVALVLIAIVVGAVILQSQTHDAIPVTLTNSLALGAGATNTLEPPTDTLIPTATTPPTDTALPPTVPPVPTSVPPAAFLPTEVPSGVPGAATDPATATDVPTATAGVTRTLVAGNTPFNAQPTGNAVASPTPQKVVISGDYDMLQALGNLPTSKIAWNKDWFGPAGDGWQLGNAARSAGNAPLVVRLGPDVMTQLFGTDAARHVDSINASLELVSYDKTLLPTGQVSFGIGMESVGGQRSTVQAVLVQSNVVNLGVNTNGKFNRKTQLPMTTVRFTAMVQRNDDGTLSLYVNGQLLGTSGASYSANSPINIYMFTSAGGIVVNVTALSVHLN